MNHLYHGELLHNQRVSVLWEQVWDHFFFSTMICIKIIEDLHVHQETTVSTCPGLVKPIKRVSLVASWVPRRKRKSQMRLRWTKASKSHLVAEFPGSIGDDHNLSGWWFGTFFVFPYIGNNHPNWLIFFRGVETTNQLCMMGSSRLSQGQWERGIWGS